MLVFLTITSLGIFDSPSIISPFSNSATSFISSKVTGSTFPLTAKTELIFCTASSKFSLIPAIAAKKRFPKHCPFKLPSVNLYCNRSSIKGSVSANAKMQFLISPGGSIPKSSLIFPDPPPSSPTVTIAVIWLVYFFNPLNMVESPVPPPITTTLASLFSFIIIVFYLPYVHLP